MGRALALLFSVLAVAAAPSASAPLAPVLDAESARTVTPGLAAALSSPDESIAANAALALGRTKQGAAEPLLLAHIRDPRAAVRAMAVYGLGLIASGRHASVILDALGDANGAVRIAALDAADRYAAANLLAPGDAAMFVAGTQRTLAHDPDPIVRARAAATLASFAQSPDALSIVSVLETAVAHDPSPRVREFAMWSLYRAYSSSASNDFLVGMLHDPDEIVRIEAVRAVGRRKDASDVPAVTALLSDPSWRVQEQASETLRLLHGEELTQHWTAIPAWVHTPAPVPDSLASLPALPRLSVGARPVRPTLAQALAVDRIALDPTTSAAMTGPAPGPHPRVRIVTTQGNLYVTLFPEWAPFTVANFLNLAQSGYYDRNRWFRIVPDFVVQTGDPNDNGNGDAGYSIPAEENPIPQSSYVISMGLNYTSGADAHAIRDSAGTQYYITLSPQLHLDRDFTVFGEVTSGFDVLGRLKESDRVLRVERVADETL